MRAPLLVIEHLVKRFGGLTVTDIARFSVERGEVHALIGPNGAGKTTLVHQVSGALAPDAGRIVFDGSEVTSLPMHRRVLRGLARSYQVTSSFRRFSVHDNLALAVQARSGSSLRFWKRARDESERYDEAAAIAHRVGLGSRLHVPAGALAHGEQRQLEVGLAIATRPKLLLLDEPMAGIGPDESERMVELLNGLRHEATVLLVEHDMDTVFRLADRISALVSGRVIATGSARDIRENLEVRHAYLGDDHMLEPMR